MGVLLTTERLELREITPSDFDFLIGLELRPETYYYEKDVPSPKEEIIAHYQWYMDQSKKIPKTGAICFAIAIAQTQEVIGNIHVKCNWEANNEWEFGYALLPPYWGKGFASEAAKALVRYVFEQLRIHKLVAFCNAENTKSFALMERLGMKKESHLREDRWIHQRWYDSFYYTFLKNDLDFHSRTL